MLMAVNQIQQELTHQGPNFSYKIVIQSLNKLFTFHLDLLLDDDTGSSLYLTRFSVYN